MLALVDPETRIPSAHPIRAVRAPTAAALAELSPVFDAMYASGTAAPDAAAAGHCASRPAGASLAVEGSR